MSRSLSYLRRGLLGISIVGSLGFGVTQAFATPATNAQAGYCTQQEQVDCYMDCRSVGLVGYCNGETGCHCEIA